MKILALDTTTKFLTIGLYDGVKIYEYTLNLGILQSSLLVPTIKRIIEALKWRLDDIDYFACGLGPGSFTGIRVGMSTIKGLAWSLKKPIVGISTLDILAGNAAEFKEVIFPVVDAKRSLIYCGAFKFERGKLKKIMPYLLLTKEELIKRIKPNSILLGDALNLYKEDISRNARNTLFLESDYWYPKGRNIIQLALEKIKANELSDAFKIQPIYLYPDDCQIKAKTGDASRFLLGTQKRLRVFKGK